MEQQFLKDNAKQPCEVFYYPYDEKYAEDIRMFQGCPSIAITPKGRIYAVWYAGGVCEPHIENFSDLRYSDDDGKTWQPLLAIPSSEERWVHALDPQLWTAPDGSLHYYWVQNNIRPEGVGEPGYTSHGWIFDDRRHTEWRMICKDPDAEHPTFGEPELLDIGFLRCKPLLTSSGRIINFNYDQLCDQYGYSVSDDGGKTYTRHYGAKKVPTPFDESMAYQMLDGTIRMFARTSVGGVAEACSRDDGMTWDAEAKVNGLLNPSTRLYVGRTPSGRVLLVNNDDNRKRINMTVYLSDDDGKTWPYKRCIDVRNGTSYPDVDFHDGKIYIIYDRDRNVQREILLLVCTEEEIMDESKPLVPRIISKPKTAKE